MTHVIWSMASASALLALLWVIPATPQPMFGYEEPGSGCQDIQETAGLCLEGSGSGEDSPEITLHKPALRTVCRSGRMVTWVPDPSVSEQTYQYAMVQDCPMTPEVPAHSSVARCNIHHHNVNGNEMSLMLPVTSASTNLTYFNRYCFLCSGDAGPEVTWFVNVSCTQWVGLQSLGSEKEVLLAALESGVCSMELQAPTNVNAEPCAQTVDSSHSLPPRIEEALGLRPHPVGAPLSVLLYFRDTGPTDLPPGGSGSEYVDHGDGGGRGGKNATMTLAAGANDGCSGFVLYRIYEKRCMRRTCAPGKRLEHHTCQPVIRRSRGLHYSLTLLIDVRALVDSGDVITGQMTPQAWAASLCSLEELITAGVTQHTSQLHSEAYNLTGWVLSYQQDSEFVGIPVEPTYGVENDLFFDDGTTASGSEGEGVLDVIVEGQEVRVGRVLIWFDFFVTSDTDRKEVEQSALRMSKEEWLVVCGHTSVRLAPTLQPRGKGDTAQGQPSFSESFVKASAHSLTFDAYKTSSVAMTVSPLLLCPFLIFERSDYLIEELSTREEHEHSVNLTLLNVTETVPSNQLETDAEGNVKICAVLFEEKFEELLVVSFKPVVDAVSFWALLEHYLSLVCVSMSLLCLLLTMVTYAMFRSLRTVPGQNTLALCVNLFLAQALLQFGVSWTELEAGCVALGMMIHYFWLCSVLWMNVCSFHMFRVFTARRAARMTSTHLMCCARRVVAYAVYAQGVPLVVIGATTSTAILLSQGRQVGYGGDVCYLSSPVLVGAAFAAPLGFVLLLNLAFFLSAVKEIAKTEAPAPAASHNGYGSSHATRFPGLWRRNLNVCMRLSSLTGLFWALGLVAELLDLRALRLVSVVVNGSQGVLIAASYLPTRRVLRLYAQGCYCCCVCRGGLTKQPRASSVSPPPGSTPLPMGNARLSSATVSTSALNISENTNGNLQASQV